MMETPTPFKVLAADFSTSVGEATITFTLDQPSTEEWRRLVNPIDDGGDLKRCIELLLERCREVG